MVYYRKYRPQTIRELDSSSLRETLTAVLSRPEIPHAFLLTGPKGLGKTSTARIIAKVINCEHVNQNPDAKKLKQGKETESQKLEKPIQDPVFIEPDNICEQCLSITNGSNLDVMEIDGASNRGIDEIRDLRDKVKLAPSRAKKKVYIIDEVHMLTTEAFNALLKTIEEPPSHVVFIFCTTEPQKVPETILSRCFHVPYLLATEDDLVRSFKRIVAEEKIHITDEALHKIASLAGGGFRDGTKILEEVVMLAQGKEITEELIESKFQISSIQFQVSSFLEMMAKKDAKGSLEIVAHLVKQGIDMKNFLTQLLERIHEVLLQQVGISSPTVNHQLSTINIVDIQALISLFSEAYRETKYAVIPELPLELAAITWCNSAQAVGSSIDELVQDDNKHTMNTLLKKEKNLKVQSILRPKVDMSLDKKGTTNSQTGAKDSAGNQEPDEDKAGSQEKITDKTTTQQFMDNLIYKVQPLNFSIAGVLRGCLVGKLTSEQVTFITTYKFHKERLEDGKTKDIIEKAIREITGKPLKVVVELKG